MTGNRSLWRKTILSVGILLAASACSEMMNDGRAAVDWERTHKIDVTSQFVTTPVSVPTDGGPLAAAEGSKLDKIVADFIQVGGGVLEIAVSKGIGDEARALARAEVVRNYALKRGALSREIEMRISNVASDGPVVVSYERFTALPPNCRATAMNLSFNPRNLPPDTLGCATQRNLAEMISNPADLVRMRQGRTTDATRRTKVIRDHRAGASPASAHGVAQGL